MHPSKLRVGSLLRVRVPEQETTPGEPAATGEQKVRRAVATDKGALFLDTAGKIVSSQIHCAGYFGRKPEELVGLDLKDLLKPDFAQKFTDALEKGRKGGVQTFQAVALRKDGSEFPTQLAFKFLHGTLDFCWTVFVQAPPGHVGGTDYKSSNGRSGSESQPSPELKPTVATTETATHGETQEPESPAGDEQELQSLRVRAEESETARKLLMADLENVRNSNKLLRKKEEELNAELQKLQAAVEQTAGQGVDTQFSARRVEELEQQLKDANANVSAARADLDQERDAIKVAQQIAEGLNTQIQKLRGAAEQAEARAHESEAQSRDWQQKAADLEKTVDELTRSRDAEKNADVQSAQRVKELEQQLNEANASLAETNTKSKADLEKERDAKELWQKEKEELTAQVQTLKSATEQAEVRARESAAQSRDWEKKAADLKTAVDELTRSHTAGKNADAQSTQRVEQLEEQLRDANASVTAAKTEAEKLEAENRQLNETNARNNVALDMERDAHQLFREKATELNTRIQELQRAADQSEARAAESAAQSRDWEKKAADLKMTVDELTRSHTAGKNADAQSAQRVQELEQQLEEANASLTAGRTEAEKQNSARERLEAENRNLAETNAQAKADLEKERDANELSQKEKEELNAQVQELKSVAEQAEARARESAAQCKDWEKKAADLKKSVDEFTRSLTAEKNAAAQSAQHVEELEQQLEEANTSLTAGRTEAEKQNSARQRLEAENRNLAETNAQAKADLKQERDFKKLSEKEKEKLNAQLQKLKSAAEQTEARARESAAQSKDWQKMAAELKKSVEELTRSHAVERNAATQSALRVEELEEQLKRAVDDLAASKAEAIANRYPARLDAGKCTVTADATVWADLLQAAESKATLEKKVGEREEHVLGRQRAENRASTAAAKFAKLKEKLKAKP
ncbi:MAG TPA: PAS domain-containing protein [Verrucomicrobiae bacterium]|nr:PAS domain-containing protein [Verrucomicrobiae bacterium]